MAKRSLGSAAGNYYDVELYGPPPKRQCCLPPNPLQEAINDATIQLTLKVVSDHTEVILNDILKELHDFTITRDALFPDLNIMHIPEQDCTDYDNFRYFDWKIDELEQKKIKANTIHLEGYKNWSKFVFSKR